MLAVGKESTGARCAMLVIITKHSASKQANIYLLTLEGGGGL